MIASYRYEYPLHDPAALVEPHALYRACSSRPRRMAS